MRVDPTIFNQAERGRLHPLVGRHFMVRFIDIRGQGTGKRFAFWDTGHDVFLSFGDDSAWETRGDFTDSFNSSGGSDGVSESRIDRFTGLMPAWTETPMRDDDELSPFWRSGKTIQWGDVICRVTKVDGGLIDITTPHGTVIRMGACAFADKAKAVEDRADPLARRLFREQAVTISKSGSAVRIDCDNGDDANLVFEWLTLLAEKAATNDAAQR